MLPVTRSDKMKQDCQAALRKGKSLGGSRRNLLVLYDNYAVKYENMCIWQRDTVFVIKMASKNVQELRKQPINLMDFDTDIW